MTSQSPKTQPLLIAPNFSRPDYLRVTPASAGWEYLHFSACRLPAGETWSMETGQNELALVVLSGTGSVISDRGEWPGIGGRSSVFAGMPYTLYLPRRTRFTVRAESDVLDFACGWCPAATDHPPRLVRPADVTVEIRGGDNVTRQINQMIPPGFDCDRIVVVEVYTPSGNWSSFPPHKHDQHRVDADGHLLEADLEEIYFYKIERPEGFAYQRIYTGDGRLNELLLARDSQLVLSPEGYHPVVAGPGSHVYYLNMLAGSAQSLAASDDPAYAWIKNSWTGQDPRLPLVRL